FIPVKEVALAVPVAKEEPGCAPVFLSLARLKKRTEWCNASSGAYHDDWGRWIGWQAKVSIGLNKNPKRISSCPLGQKRRADSLSLPSVALVTHHAYSQMHISPCRLLVGGN